MQLNLPIVEQLKDSQNILLAGAGGGFDIFAGLPIYFTLRDMGKTVHLANYSFSDFFAARNRSQYEEPLAERLMGVSGEVQRLSPYYPEGFLAEWFKLVRGEDVTVWIFAKTGLEPLIECYKYLIEHLKIDAIILVDGGVDSLMQGNESRPGTLLEDSISLGAVASLSDMPVKIVTAIGFGTEVSEGISHYHVLENMATFVREGGFLGCCSLTAQMEAFQQYKAACLHVWEKPVHAKSHISTRIIPAVEGEFGNFHMYQDDWKSVLYISALMSIYWFFQVDVVAKQNMLIPALQGTKTQREAWHHAADLLVTFRARQPKTLPY